MLPWRATAANVPLRTKRLLRQVHEALDLLAALQVYRCHLQQQQQQQQQQLVLVVSRQMIYAAFSHFEFAYAWQLR